jgi:glutamate-1-semialdehyde aminotransferase
MLDRGVYLPPSQFEAGSRRWRIPDAHVERRLGAGSRALAEL